MLRMVLSREDYKKVMMIKKLARRRFKRFWREWGITKTEAEVFGGTFVLCLGIVLMYTMIRMVC